MGGRPCCRRYWCWEPQFLRGVTPAFPTPRPSATSPTKTEGPACPVRLLPTRREPASRFSSGFPTKSRGPSTVSTTTPPTSRSEFRPLGPCRPASPTERAVNKSDASTNNTNQPGDPVAGWSCAVEDTTAGGTVHKVVHYSGPASTLTANASGAQFFAVKATTPSPSVQTRYDETAGNGEGFFVTQTYASGASRYWRPAAGTNPADFPSRLRVLPATLRAPRPPDWCERWRRSEARRRPPAHPLRRP